LDTYQNVSWGEPSANFVGLAAGAAGDTQLTYAATATGVASLTNATHHFDVTVVNGHVQVKMDGVLVIDQVMALPSQVLVGFSAGTGGATDVHSISNVVITTGGGTPAGQLSVSPGSVAFGSVASGGTGSASVTVSNTGSAALTVSSTSAPTAPFGDLDPGGWFGDGHGDVLADGGGVVRFVVGDRVVGGFGVGAAVGFFAVGWWWFGAGAVGGWVDVVWFVGVAGCGVAVDAGDGVSGGFGVLAGVGAVGGVVGVV
jgi:hypothetical protein